MNEPDTTAVIRYSPWPHRLSVMTVGVTLLLILMGGLVTNTGSALAVPDWPTTFGYNMFLYPWSKMVGGIFYEHAHRLLGSAVGLLTIAMAVAVWRCESRRWVRSLAATAILAVVLQGILGGLRVVLLQHGLAMVHGSFAQAFLGLLVSISVVTSSGWQRAEPSLVASSPRVRLLARLLAPLVYLQLVFGAVLTHTATRLDAHLLFAGLVTLAVGLLAVEMLRGDGGPSYLRRPVTGLTCLVGLQLALGLGAYLWRFTGMSAALSPAGGLALLAAHRLTGTALWATTLVVVLRLLRLEDAPAATVPEADGIRAREVAA